MEVLINVWKESGKWYVTENMEVESVEEIDLTMNNFGRYHGMKATVSYRREGYWQPYRMFQL